MRDRDRTPPWEGGGRPQPGGERGQQGGAIKAQQMPPPSQATQPGNPPQARPTAAACSRFFALPHLTFHRAPALYFFSLFSWFFTYLSLFFFFWFFSFSVFFRFFFYFFCPIEKPILSLRCDIFVKSDAFNSLIFSVLKIAHVTKSANRKYKIGQSNVQILANRYFPKESGLLKVSIVFLRHLV